MSMKQKIFLLSLYGIFHTLSFPYISLGFTAWFAFVFFFFALDDDNLSKKKTFLLGLFSGAFFCFFTFSWVIHSMNVYGGLPLSLCYMAFLVLCFYIGLYNAFFALFFKMSKNIAGYKAVFLIPCFWVFLEFIRGYSFLAFPWSLLGYSQTDYFPFLQIAEYGGIWLVSFFVMYLNVLIYVLLKDRLKSRKPSPKLIAPFAVIMVLILANGIYVNEKYSFPVKSKSLSFGILQGNIDQSVKWSDDSKASTLDLYEEMINSFENKEDIDLFIMPETAVPFNIMTADPFAKRVRDFPINERVNIFTGAPYYEYSLRDSDYLFYNSAFLLTKNGKIDRFDKTRLVPFGEYVPLQKFLPFIKKLVPMIGEFRGGTSFEPMTVNGIKIAPLICYEAIFPEISTKFVNNGANLLINITNDGWFGTTRGPYQHLQMARFRSVETRLYFLRAANTGISAMIDPLGEVKESLALGERGALEVDFKNRENDRTFYVKYGTFLNSIYIIVSILFLVYQFNLRRKRKNV